MMLNFDFMTFEKDYDAIVNYAKYIIKSKDYVFIDAADIVSDAYLYIVDNNIPYDFFTLKTTIKSLISLYLRKEKATRTGQKENVTTKTFFHNELHKCRKCKEYKTCNEFYYIRSYKYGYNYLDNRCKKCNSIRCTEKNNRHKEDRREYRAAYRKKNILKLKKQEKEYRKKYPDDHRKANADCQKRAVEECNDRYVRSLLINIDKAPKEIINQKMIEERRKIILNKRAAKQRKS